MYREETGNLFELDLPAIGHGVNCRGAMGAGIARVFRNQFPLMYEQYAELCRLDRLQPGGMMTWNANLRHRPITVYNLATQREPGADATLEWVRHSIHMALDHATGHHIAAIGLPRIGCGIGGLEWPAVQAIMQLAAEQHPLVDLVAVTLPDQV